MFVLRLLRVVPLLVCVITATSPAVANNITDVGVAALAEQTSPITDGVDWTIQPVACHEDVCGGCADEPWIDYTARVRGGLTYFDDVSDSQLGLGYSLDMAVALTDSISGFLSASHNHFDQGSQYLGTLGAFRQGQVCGDWTDRLSGGVLFDQFTDTRFDDLYITQFRYFAGFALTDQLAMGVTYTDPLDGDRATVGLPAGPAVANFRTAEVIEGYLSARWDANSIVASVGHREDVDAVVVGLLARRQFSHNLGGYTAMNYQDARTWSAGAGIEIWFGPGAERCYGGMYCSHDPAPQDMIVRGQSSSIPGNPFNDPSLGHNLHYTAQQMGSQITGSTPGGVVIASTGVEEDPNMEMYGEGPTLMIGTINTNRVANDIDPRLLRAR